jgi:amino acid adenylation domain-containing protein
MGDMNLPDLQLSSMQPEKGTSLFDLTPTFWDTDAGIHGYFEYNTDLFTADTVERMVVNFERLVKSLVANPDVSVGKAELMLPAEIEKQLVTWNETAIEYPRHTMWWERFVKNAATFPERTAVISQGKSLTFGELNKRSNQLAHYLQANGAQPDQLIGVYLERSVALLVTTLGIMKSGAAYVPLDPTYPPERIVMMMEDAGISTIIHGNTEAPNLPDLQTAYHQPLTFLNVMDEWATIAQADDSTPPVVAKMDNLAYTVFTSGSTGRPKGVQASHRNLSHFLEAMAKNPGLTADDTIMAVVTLSFDPSKQDLYLPLYVGGKVVIATDEERNDPLLLSALLEKYQPTFMQATPSTWNMLLVGGWRPHAGFRMMSGGEPLTKQMGNQLRRDDNELWNMYGPTEVTVWATAMAVSQAQLDAKEAVPLGRPVPNTRLYVLDPQMRPVPQGVAGELYIGGEGVVRGYASRPDLTADRFVPNPFVQDGDSTNRLYRTGDLVRLLPDGKLTFLGRVDFQVKVRGFRIELGEIEARLNAHPAVGQAVVVAQADNMGSNRLLGFVVADTKLEMEALQAFVGEKMPAYMIPTLMTQLDEFPLMPNGKVNRKELMAIDATCLIKPRVYTAPRTPIEEKLATVWRELLGVPQVGIHDHFFQLGGHSLLATQLIARIRHAFAINLPLAELFNTPTVAHLANLIETKQEEAKQLDEMAQILADVEMLSDDALHAAMEI